MKDKVLMLGVLLIVFGGLIAFWLNSPFYKQEKVSQWAQVRNYLSANYYFISAGEKSFYMREYRIIDDQINPTKLLRQFKTSQ